MSGDAMRALEHDAEPVLRQEIVRACRTLQNEGLARGTAGNISARSGDGLLISPSAVPYDALGPGDIVRLDPAGAAEGADVDGARRPSSEWRMHVAIMRSRPGIGAIVHTHSPFATALACLRRPIPAFHYMVAIAGGSDIPCAPYARFGTQELAEYAAAALAERDACLLANHGAIAVGRDVGAALALAIELEGLAEQYARALQMGEPVLLGAAEMEQALAAFADYRQGSRAIAPAPTRGLR